MVMVLALLVIGNAAHSATITWTNTSGGYWSDAANWSPNRVPTNTDDVLITTPGTYTVAWDVINYNYYTTNVANLTLGAGGGAAGVQSLFMPSLSGQYSILWVNSLMLVTNGGVLLMTNGYVVANPLLIDKGGVLNGSGAYVNGGTLTIANGGVMNSLKGNLDATITVTNGGVLNANNDAFAGTVTVAHGGLMNVTEVYFNSPLSVAHGGNLNILPNPATFHPWVSVNYPVVNSGMITVTNAGINFYYGSDYGTYGTLVNLPGGVINVQGSSNIGMNGSGYFINQGSLIESTGPGSSVYFDDYFDNSQGTITNLAGTLVLGTYQTNLAGIYYTAVGATNQFIGVNSSTPLVPGTPFVLAGSGQYQFIAGFLALTNKAYPNLELIADKLVLGPAFEGGAITNLSLNGISLSNSLPVTGVFAATNSGIDGNFTIASGGVFTESNSATYGAITVASGGQFIANGGGHGYVAGPLTVAPGAVLNIAGALSLFGPLTNAGTINLTNSPININNPYLIYFLLGGIINQAGGAVNFRGSTSIGGGGYFVNQGTVTGSVGTNSISCQMFDNTQGTITNLAGTLGLGFYQTNLTGTYFAAAGATIQFIGGTVASPVSPGTPLVLGGSGSYQFISDLVSLGIHGYLYLPTSVIPNLSMQGGLLELGPGFQGGAITNLTLNGIALTNQLGTTLPITGKFTVLNSGGFLFDYGAHPIPTGVYGNYTVAGGGTLTASNSFMRGAVTVAGGGIMNMMRASMFGPLMLASGGLITVTGGGGTIYPSGSLTVTAGGTINITQSGLVLEGPLNNAGTINITNPPTGGFGSVITSINDGSAYQGGIINQASGLINLGSDKTFLNTDGDSFGGHEYIVNQGRITKSDGTNISGFSVPFLTNSGAITVQSGIISMRPFVTQSGGSLNISLNSATNYGSFLITSNIVLAGAFNATLANGYVPTSGTSFSVMTYSNYSGSFSSLGLPSAVNWQSTYGSTNFTLVAGSPKPQFGTFNLSGTNLIFNGIGGSPGSNYVILTSTNLTLLLANWSALTTNTFDGSGQFRYTNPISPVKPRQFFIFKLP